MANRLSVKARLIYVPILRRIPGLTKVAKPAMLGRMNAAQAHTIREDVLRDTRHPVHKIADRLMPFLRVLVEQFHPQQIILFGSYAYGNPDEHSDVDLLIIKELDQSPVREATQILKAWRPIRWQGNSLPFELRIETPVNHEARAKQAGSFYSEAVRTGLRLA